MHNHNAAPRTGRLFWYSSIWLARRGTIGTMEIAFVTSNRGKFLELRDTLDIPLSQVEIDLPEIQELRLAAVVRAKLQAAFSRLHKPCIVEDTSLSLRCLNGLPGPFIKWFLATVGNEGIYEIARRMGDNHATATTVIGYCDAKGTPALFRGEIDGTIVSPQGKQGFGWDAIFQPEGSARTFAQMPAEEKAKCSMRAQAVRQLADFLQSTRS
ncbi:non-canonical purine NTP pyrophosphatase [Candidatus Parcubacteria bacterium]|nr:MAG: non-canonical purine NTP pyrophosphatase [Candidatus Parcubacteria bacterium]